MTLKPLGSFRQHQLRAAADKLEIIIWLEKSDLSALGNWLPWLDGKETEQPTINKTKEYY